MQPDEEDDGYGEDSDYDEDFEEDTEEDIEEDANGCWRRGNERVKSSDEQNVG